LPADELSRAAEELSRAAEELFADPPPAGSTPSGAPARRVTHSSRASLTPEPPALPPGARAPRRTGRAPAPARRRPPRERAADRLTLAGGIALLLSLFMPWSHQLSPSLLRAFAGTPALRGVPAAPDAWQVYSIVDVLLAALAAALAVVAVVGGRRARVITGVFVVIALAFTAHALARPPTNGTNLVAGALTPVRYVPNHASAGAGELVALIALGAAAIGIAITPPRLLCSKP